MEWGFPSYFVWLWAVAAAAAVFVLAARRKRAMIRRFGEEDLITRLVSSLDPVARLAKRIFFLAALFCIVLALAQPHWRKKETLVERRGIDVVIAVDVSQSMLAKDISPNRLEKAKLELAGLIDSLKGDRVGIVAFAGEAFIQCPLTLDRNAAKLFLSTVHPNLIPAPGTSVTKAIGASMQAFDEKDKGAKALILLTDGENHEEGALQAAERAGKQGARIYTIGVGTPDGSTLPIEGSIGGVKKDARGNIVISKLNESFLKEIAAATGGAYFRASRGELEADRLSGEIRRLSDRALRSEWSVEYEENYQLLLVIAFMLLSAEWFVSERRSDRGRDRAFAVFFALAMLPLVTGFDFTARVKNEQGNKLYGEGKIGRAQKKYESAAKDKPDSPEIAYNLGNAYYKEEVFERSLEGYRKAADAEKNPSLQAKAFYNLGNALVRRGEAVKAVEFYKQALRLDPDDKDAKFNLELLTKRQEEEKKNPDQPKKDQDKQQQQKQQKQDQQQNQQNQQNQKDKEGGQSQEQDQKENKPQGQQNQPKDQKEGSQEPQQGQSQEQKDQDQQKEENKPESGQESQDRSSEKGEEEKKEDGEPKEQTGEEEKSEAEKQKQENESQAELQDGKEEEKREQEDTRAGEGREGDKEQKQPVPKTDAEIRAEQILNAIENHEKQTLKLQGGTRAKTPRRAVEKDW